MNKVLWTVAAALAPVALSAPSFAQPETTAPTIPGAPSNADSKTAAAPVEGANSFTVDEARRRIEAGGFAEVPGLKKDGDDTWRGQAMRDGISVSVFCNDQGNVGVS